MQTRITIFAIVNVLEKLLFVKDSGSESVTTPKKSCSRSTTSMTPTFLGWAFEWKPRGPRGGG